MNLLPKNKDQFRSSSYWEEFFKKRQQNFEWYGNYSQLCGILHKYIKPANKLVVIGCGNSNLSEDLYDVGHHDITNVDISDIVIRQMIDKNGKQRPKMKWLKMDVKKMDFEDGTFSAVIDKGTLDALMTDDTTEVTDDITQMFTEICRVLKVMGRYICVTLLQEHILTAILRFFTELFWHIRIHKVTVTSDDQDSHLTVFVVVCTKFKKLPNVTNSLLEICAFDDTVKRCTDTEEMVAFVKEIQYYATVQHQLAQQSVEGESVSVQLYSPDSEHPRYTLHVVDRGDHSDKPFAIFIVPQGREVEAMFSTDDGRRDLASSAQFDRLIVVSLNPFHSYTDLDSIQSELSAKVMELAPKGLDPKTQVPFLSVGTDIGKRTILTQGKTDVSGEYIVQEVEIDGVKFRRLVFVDSLNVVWSEVRLCKGHSRKSGKRKRTRYSTIDNSYLPSRDLNIIGGLALVHSFPSLIDTEMKVLYVGMGWNLSGFIHNHLPTIQLTMVVRDPEMVTIATNSFGLQQSERVTIVEGDGASVIMDAVKHSVFMVNLSCQDKASKQTTLDSIKQQFHSVSTCKADDDINEVIYATTCDCSSCAHDLENVRDKNVQKLNDILQKLSSSDNSLPDLTEALSNLEVLH